MAIFDMHVSIPIDTMRRLYEIEQRYQCLLAAVRKHHSLRNHRCWDTDLELYRAAGLEPDNCIEESNHGKEEGVS